MKKILCLALACLMLLCAFISCESEEGVKCNHEGATLGWAVNETIHRQIYTCCGAVKQEGNHEVVDGTCKICGVGNLPEESYDDVVEETLSKAEIEALFKSLKTTHYATIDIENYGKIKLALYGEVAPITVANFAKLANEGFYDGLTFHRVAKDFLIQGGSLNGDGLGTGNETTIKGEFELNGHANNIPHVRGVISMARSDYSYDSASTQFFIMHSDYTGLDGAYAAFGYVIEGLDVVDDICDSVEATDDFGTVPAEKQPKIISVKIETVK